MTMHAEKRGWIHGAKLCRRSPSISHLLFVDHSFFFFNADEDESRRVKTILNQYEEASGQVINFQNFGGFYSSNTPLELCSHLNNILEVHNSINHGSYMGLPSLVGRSKKSAFAFIKYMFVKMMKGWTHKFLS